MWGMNVSPISPCPSPPIAFRSLIRAVENALRPNCSPCRPTICEPSPVACPPRDCGTGTSNDRWLLNAAGNEISRLRNQVAMLEATLARLTPPRGCEGSNAMDSTMFDLSKASHARRAYAVAPVGEIPSATPSPSIAVETTIIQSMQVVTNLGSLMDVLI